MPLQLLSDLSDGKDAPLADLPGPASHVPPLKACGRIPSFIALTAGPDGGFLTADRDGWLRAYSADLTPLGRARLKQPAYRMALDARSGRLYAAVARRTRFSVPGDLEQAVGELCAFDVSALWRGESPAEELPPLQRLALDAHVSGLQLSADGRWLAYVAEWNSSASLNRVAAATLEGQRRQEPILPTGLTALVSAGDGMLLALGGGVLYRVRFEPWDAAPFGLVSNPVLALASSGDGRVYVLERRPSLCVLVCDVRPGKLLRRLSVPFTGRLSLAASGDQLYLGSSAVLDGQVQAFDLACPQTRLLGGAGRDPDRLLRGPLYLVPDNRHLLTGNGHVFLTPKAPARALSASAPLP